MKKVGILFMLLSALSFSATSKKSSKSVETQSVTSRFNQLEAELERLINMEDQEYNKLKATAEAAAEKLAEKSAQKAQIEEKIAKIEASSSNTKAFKTQYGDIIKQYKAVVKSLDAEIKSLTTTVDNFAAIESVKGN